MSAAEIAPRKRVFVISPLRAAGLRTQEMNEKYAWMLCEKLSKRGFAPFAPHTFYTMFLDDSNTAERAEGMENGAAWLLAADFAFVSSEFGISAGMEKEIAFCRRHNIPVVIWDGESDLTLILSLGSRS